MTKLAALLLALSVTAAAQPSAAPPAKEPPLYDQGLVTGAVPGLPGYKLTVTRSANHCGGKKLAITRPRKKPVVNAELAAVFDLEFPTKLSFEPGPEKKVEREKSLQRFSAFVAQMQKTSTAALNHYGDQLKRDPETMYEASARILQLHVQTARLLAYAEIPKDIRTGELKDEKIEAYCDKMVEVAEPLDARAKEALAHCQPGATQFPATWWAPLCR